MVELDGRSLGTPLPPMESAPRRGKWTTVAMTVAGFALLAVGVVVHSSGEGAGVELKQVSLSAWACAAGRLRRPCLPWHPCMATTAQIIPAALEVVAAKAFLFHTRMSEGGSKSTCCASLRGRFWWRRNCPGWEQTDALFALPARTHRRSFSSQRSHRSKPISQSTAPPRPRPRPR